MQWIAPSERAAQELARLLGELRGLLVKLGARRVLQELLEAEQREFLAADRYERNGERGGHHFQYRPLGGESCRLHHGVVSSHPLGLSQIQDAGDTPRWRILTGQDETGHPLDRLVRLGAHYLSQMVCCHESHAMSALPPRRVTPPVWLYADRACSCAW